MCGVYMIKNKVNGKFYIGSSIDIHVRWTKHKRCLRNGNHHSLHLQRAWDKYGEDNFDFIVLEETDPDKTYEREQHYLDILKPYDNSIGYNMIHNAVGGGLCGELNPMFGKHHSEETIDKIRQAKIGVKHTDEWKEHLREYWKTHTPPMTGRTGELATCYGRTGDKHPMWGIKGGDHPSAKSVICLNNGMIFDSAKDAAAWANCNYSKLCMCCRGERKSCGTIEGEKLLWAFYEKEGSDNYGYISATG